MEIVRTYGQRGCDTSLGRSNALAGAPCNQLFCQHYPNIASLAACGFAQHKSLVIIHAPFLAEVKYLLKTKLCQHNYGSTMLSTKSGPCICSATDSSLENNRHYSILISTQTLPKKHPFKIWRTGSPHTPLFNIYIINNTIHTQHASPLPLQAVFLFLLVSGRPMDLWGSKNPVAHVD
jgi:hypothetical protein